MGLRCGSQRRVFDLETSKPGVREHAYGALGASRVLASMPSLLTRDYENFQRSNFGISLAFVDDIHNFPSETFTVRLFSTLH